MKNVLKYLAASVLAVVCASSCEDFLDRPAEDTYNESNFYQNDAQCIQGVNYLYNSPWYDVIRGYYKVGETFSGNYYTGQGNAYLMMTVNGSDEDLKAMSQSLWAVNANCSVVYNRLKTAVCSESVRAQCMGETLVWKAMAYFFLVRSFGDVPLIHDPVAEMAGGEYNSLYKTDKRDVYEYIVMTLEKAMELLPKKVANKDGRIDWYSAEALLAKVYLTKAGVSGTLDQDDLDKAAAYAKDVIDNSGRELLYNYSDVFRLQNNKSLEALISWHWTVSNVWTTQNGFQSDLAPNGFDEYGDNWGQWVGPSVDLQEAFNVTADMDPATRIDTDARRKATYMLAGDVYDYFWTDMGGFDYLRFFYDPDYGPGGLPNASDQSMNNPTGAACVKFLYGDNADHIAAGYGSAGRMASSLATHILRLSDVYLIYAEAKLHGPGSRTSDASACEAYWTVRNRAVKTYYDVPSSITWEDVWKERRLELALEGDRWYDFVRLSYYNFDYAKNEIESQHRNSFSGGTSLNDVCKTYYETGVWDASGVTYNTAENAIPSVTASTFSLPFPAEDVVFNPNLNEPAVRNDVRSNYSF